MADASCSAVSAIDRHQRQSVRSWPRGRWTLVDEHELEIAQLAVADKQDHLLLHRNGVPFDSAKFGYEVRAARRRAGLPDSITFHDYAPLLRQRPDPRGFSVKQVQAALGHKSAKVTVDVYGRLWPGEEDPVRDAIGRLGRPDELRGAQG